LLQLFQTASRYEMEVQPSLVLLQKTMLNVEGLGKQLYPELDLWQTALPFLEEWQRKRLSPLNNLKIIREKLPEWIEKFPDIPELVYDNLQDHRNTRKNLQAQVDHLLNSQEDLRRQANARRHRNGLVLAVIGLVTLLPGLQTAVEGMPLFSTALLVVGIGLLLTRR
jgi:ubiquinone biosynthesis protein